MTDNFNPLYKNRKIYKNVPVATSSVELTAAANDYDSVPLSPISGRPMVKAYCRTVPVWVDPYNRLVLPMKAN